MYEFVFASHAVTRQGQWVTPLTIVQQDYDGLFCIHCRLRLGVHIDPLTGVKSFIHTPGSIDKVKELKNCPYNPNRTTTEWSNPAQPVMQLSHASFSTKRQYSAGNAAGAIFAGLAIKCVHSARTGSMRLMHSKYLSEQLLLC